MTPHEFACKHPTMPNNSETEQDPATQQPDVDFDLEQFRDELRQNAESIDDEIRSIEEAKHVTQETLRLEFKF